MHRVTAVSHVREYVLHLRFSDGTEGDVDLSDLVGRGVFAAWNDSAHFARVAVDESAGTVTWPDGIDLCPDQLYHDVSGHPLPGRTGFPSPA